MKHTAFKKLVRSRLVAADARQTDLANAMGIDDSTLSNYLSGNRPAPSDFHDRVAAGLAKLEGAQR